MHQISRLAKDFWTKLILLFILVGSCIDPISISPNDQGIGNIVIDGGITDEPGPYTVKIERVQNIFDNDLRKGERYPVKRLTISDDLGNEEVLGEIEEGTYQTSSSGMRGQVGRSYKLRVEGTDGSIFESTTEYLEPVGELDSLYAVYEKLTPNGDHVFGIYIDARLADRETPYTRWKFNSTYRLDTNPELQLAVNRDTGIEEPDPQPCSGYFWDRRNNKVILFGECKCCTCWVSPPQSTPLVTDGKLVNDNTITRKFIVAIPISQETFQDKVVVEVVQLSLSRDTYTFWQSLETQVSQAGNLFQPLLGSIPTNIKVVKGAKRAYGLFNASGIKRKKIILTQADLPDPLPKPIPVYKYPCTDYKFSTNVRPVGWVD